MTQRLKTARILQTFTMIVFLAAAGLGCTALIFENYSAAAIDAILMVANFILYQCQSTIIREELSRAAR